MARGLTRAAENDGVSVCLQNEHVQGFALGGRTEEVIEVIYICKMKN